MNAIEIKNLTKTFGEKNAVNKLNMTVPVGAIYGFIGENGSGKSTTQKIICGLIKATSGEVKLFGKDFTDEEIRESVGVLIEAPGCYPNLSVWNNLLLHATNLDIKDKKAEVRRVLKIVRMEGAAPNKYKNCSLGMKQRIGIAMALMGKPRLLVLDEPTNGLDADGVRIVREILTQITMDGDCTVLISSHILGELEKIATHYGIIRGGKMIEELTADELEEKCPTFVSLKSNDLERAKKVLLAKYSKVTTDTVNGLLRVYGETTAQEVASYLYGQGIVVTELKTDKIGLEEYYVNLMKERR